MGVSFPAGTLVRTGAERATLVRRTYSLVFVSVLFTKVAGMPRAVSAAATALAAGDLAARAPRTAADASRLFGSVGLRIGF